MLMVFEPSWQICVAEFHLVPLDAKIELIMESSKKISVYSFNISGNRLQPFKDLSEMDGILSHISITSLMWTIIMSWWVLTWWPQSEPGT